MQSKATIQIVWFKRDLRIQDHRALLRASECGPVLPIFLVEPDLWKSADMSARQWAFVRECLTSLREDLAALGQQLIVRSGDAIEVLERILRHYGSVKLWSHEETGNSWTYNRDKRVAAWARSNGIKWEELRQSGVVRPLASRDGWARRWDAFMAQPEAPRPKLWFVWKM